MDTNQLMALLATYGNLNDEAARKAAQAAGFNVTARTRQQVEGDQFFDVEDPSLGYQAFADLGGGRVFRAYVDPATGALVEPTTYKTGFSGLGRIVQQVAPLAAMAALGGMMVPGVMGGAAAGEAAGAGALSSEVAREIAYGAIGELPGFGISGAAAGAAGAGAAAVAGGDVGMASWFPVEAVAAPAAAAAPASTLSQVLSGARSVAQVAGPLVSLAGGLQQVASLPQAPSAPRVPGVEAPPEARGYQAGRAPILDVLQRNQRANKNRTLLTGAGGVNMASVRVGRNELLGL
ncbi:MAG: hypothetical protein KJ011_06560 [Burkholderiaceae bacterium]|nr:hypothetical protein [Burkholderiaceae bacterium]